MAIRSFLILPVLLAAATAQAQSIGEPIPGQGAGKAKASPWRQDQRARPCPEYGPGYVRLEGSTACVRIGGSVGAEFGVNSRGRTGSAAAGAVRLDARNQTSLGEMRTVVQIGGRLNRNDGGYAYGYR